MKGRIFKDRLATAVLWACMGAVLAVLGGILVFLVVRGAGALSWEFLSQPPRDSMTKGGILTPLVGTVQLVVVAMAFAFPVGVLTAVYLNEYAAEDRFTRLLRLAVRSLAGVPSVVFGLFEIGIAHV